MIHSVRAAFLACAALFVATGGAFAHPHVWVTMKSEIVYAEDGTVTAVRHAWTFDDMFSTFAIQGLDTPADAQKAAKPEAAAAKPQSGGFMQWLRATWNWLIGVKSEPADRQIAQAGAAPAVASKTLSREQLQPLAEVNVTSLKEYDFFSYAKVNGKKTTFVEPKDYHLEYKDQLLTLHFLLPLQTPAKAQSFDLEVFDPSYFVDFQIAEKDAVAMAGAPAGCKLTVGRPQEMTTEMARRLSEIPAGQQIPSDTYGAQFANKIAVRCP